MSSPTRQRISRLVMSPTSHAKTGREGGAGYAPLTDAPTSNRAAAAEHQAIRCKDSGALEQRDAMRDASPSFAVRFASTTPAASAPTQSPMESRHSGAQPRKMTRSGTLRRFSSDEALLPISINEEDWERYQAKARLLFPLGSLKFRWDCLVLLLILYSSVAVPFRLGMGHPADGFWWYLEVGISLAFLTDIFFNFNTAYVDGDQLVLDKAMIRDNYLRTW